MKESIQSFLKSMLAMVRTHILSLIVSLVLTSPAIYLSLEKEVVENSNYIKWSPKLIVLLTFLLFFLLTLSTRLYFKYGRFQENYGVLWDKQFKTRWTNCRKRLKYSTHSKSVLYCSDPKCNNKHTLRDLEGNEITIKQAIELMK